MKPLISNIVVAITGTEASILAAKYAIVMAKHYNCKLHAIYVVDTATIKMLTLSKIFIQEEGAEYEKNLENNGNRYLTFIEELAKGKDVKIERILRKGAIYTEILKVADEKGADLILLGGWEKDTKTSDIIGHSHREIMANSKCSVLLVKEPNIDQIYKKA
ncbi:MAG: universal stress protein [Spirochaetes bacterium]|jgi:nucleotide-binding universal stress UspA family protein|nr:universal stress protein [Spirochaetota bacterium]